MGFKDFELMNQALLAKQAWRAVQSPDALWVKVIKGIYFPNEELLAAKKRRNSSWSWSSLLYGRDLLLEHGRWNIGNGSQVDIMTHRWLSSGERLQDGPAHLKVNGLLDNDELKWKVNTIMHLLPSTDVGKILQTPFSFSDAKDTLYWPYVPSGDYTVKSGYRTAKEAADANLSTAMSSNHPTKFLWRTIWGGKNSPKNQNLFVESM